MSRNILNKRNEPYIQHYGVPGMRWGVRKAAGAFTGPRKTEAKIAKKAIKEFKETREVERKLLGGVLVKTIERAAEADTAVNSFNNGQKAVLALVGTYAAIKLVGMFSDSLL